jgi:NNP family nitrate/nitrite transporter-like MFS transporter
VFRVIPSVFHALHQRWAKNKDAASLQLARRQAETETAVALGFAASIAAFGGFFIPIALAISSDLFGSPYFAIAAFGVSTLTFMLATWWWYYRAGAEVPC